jgi:hypothetical protein
MKKILFILFVFSFQFSLLEAGWKDKSLKDLHRAISWSNTYAIRKIIKHHPEYLNYSDSISRNTPLIRAIKYRHYAAAKQLLELGADPNVHSLTGFTPLMAAILEHPRRDFIYKETKYIRLLSEYGANINDTCHYIPKELLAGHWSNMLMLTMCHHIEKLKCLVELGADINMSGPDGCTAAIEALICDIYMAHYLIVEKKADVTRPYYTYTCKKPGRFEIDFSEKHYPIELLLKKDRVYKLESECYKLRKEIIEEFKRQGVDYQSWKERIPASTLETIKKAYGDNWEEYLRNY